MVRPTLSLTAADPRSIESDVLVLGVLPGAGDAVAMVAPAAGADSELDLAIDLGALGVTGSKDQLTRLPAPGFTARSIALIGLGGPATPDSIRVAAGSAVRQLADVATITLALPTAEPDLVEAALEGAALGSYAFTRHRGVGTTTPGRGDQSISVLVDDPALADPTRATILGEATALVRDLVNTGAGHLGPQEVADAAMEAAAGLPVAIDVLDEHALADGGFGGVLGVGAGSVRPPRVVVARYAPEDAARHLALVGKGITFDSGGLSLKPATGMLGMKDDMTGAATVLAATLAAARLGLPIRITAWLCLAENMPSGSATRPGDVLTLKNGITVEVTNTDAEGRLVLGDGLAAASAEQPDAIVDVATLTGAQVVALGDRTSGLMGDDALVEQVRAAARAAGELVWPMPLPDELDARLASDVADIVNATPGQPAAGMLLAGRFLQKFVGTGPDGAPIPWAHLDIAGPAENRGGGTGWLGKGATGVMVHTLLCLAEDMRSE